MGLLGACISIKSKIDTYQNALTVSYVGGRGDKGMTGGTLASRARSNLPEHGHPCCPTSPILLPPLLCLPPQSSASSIRAPYYPHAHPAPADPPSAHPLLRLPPQSASSLISVPFYPFPALPSPSLPFLPSSHLRDLAPHILEPIIDVL